jgi:hypothetical protein
VPHVGVLGNAGKCEHQTAKLIGGHADGLGKNTRRPESTGRRAIRNRRESSPGEMVIS